MHRTSTSIGGNSLQTPSKLRRAYYERSGEYHGQNFPQPKQIRIYSSSPPPSTGMATPSKFDRCSVIQGCKETSLIWCLTGPTHPVNIQKSSKRITFNQSFQRFFSLFSMDVLFEKKLVSPNQNTYHLKKKYFQTDGPTDLLKAGPKDEIHET